MPTPFTLAGMKRGAFAAQPLGVGVFVYGLAFGLLAREAQLSLVEALMMSGVIYSGSAQLVAVNSMAHGSMPTGAMAMATLATILLLNARYMLYGAAMRPWLGNLRPLEAYSTLAVIGDGNWILSMKASQEGEEDAGFVFGSGVAMFVPWLTGTGLGVLAGALISNPATLGLDFMLVAFSAAMGIKMFKGRSDLTIALAAAIVSVLVHTAFPGGMAILAAGLTGAAVAWASCKDHVKA